ncbi:MAG: GGDEF domain-containing protein [Chitinispirillaceae bacterium]|nr:GGDEF domain-containing protein [Chitinispirillaceae bacterium]
MPHDKKKWGIGFFCAAALLLGGPYCFYQAFPPLQHSILYQKVIPVIGLAASAFILFFGHSTYPRLHSVRVYFVGYGIGLLGIAYYCLCVPFFPLPPEVPKPAHGYDELCILICLGNLVGATLIPVSTKYRITRSSTLLIAGIEAILLVVMRFGASVSLWIRPFAFESVQEPFFWAAPLLLLSALALSLWKTNNEFFLGGIISGGALLFCAAWISRIAGGMHADHYQLLLLTANMLLLSIAMVMHGFFRMEHRISYDPLLQIYNRDYCSRIITEQANLNVAPPLGVAMVDIDHFKQVNDTYGHQAGDAVLHGVAQAVRRTAGPDSIVCRYGGEELAAFFPQRTVREVADIGERMRKEIESIKTRFGRKTIRVTASIGVSHRDAYTQSIVEVIHAADKALYAAKKGGRNQVKTQKTPLPGAKK